MKEEAEKAAAEKAVKEEMEEDFHEEDELQPADPMAADHDDGFEDDLMDGGGGGDDDRFETEDGSVCSELDSVESGSTRSTRRGQRPQAQGGGAGVRGHKKGTVRSSKKKLATVAPNNRGKGRRAIFKRSATKAPTAVARAVTSDRVFYKVLPPTIIESLMHFFGL